LTYLTFELDLGRVKINQGTRSEVICLKAIVQIHAQTHNTYSKLGTQ